MSYLSQVLKMYRTGEAESLLPVFATILAFGPEELGSCREGLRYDGEGVWKKKC